MKVQTLCRNCSNHYVLFDDNDEFIDEGCDLDLLLFHPRKAIVCSSYKDKEHRV